MVAVSVLLRLDPIMEEAILPTITISMVAALVVQLHVRIMGVDIPRTTTISMVATQVVLRLVPTMVVAIPRTITTNTVEVPVALPHALTMEVVQQPTTMTSTVAVLARQLPVKTIVVEQLRPITTLTETASGQVTVRVTIGNR